MLQQLCNAANGIRQRVIGFGADVVVVRCANVTAAAAVAANVDASIQIDGYVVHGDERQQTAKASLRVRYADNAARNQACNLALAKGRQQFQE